MGSRNKTLLKKSQGFESWFFVITALLAMALVFLILHKAYGEIKDPLDEGLSSAMPDDSSVNVSRILEQTEGTTETFDKLIPFLIIGLFAFVMIVAGSIMNHPIMIIVGIIILGVVILLAVIFSNVYNAISDNDEFSDSKSTMAITDKFMQYLPVVVFMMALAITVAFLWSRKGGGGNL